FEGGRKYMARAIVNETLCKGCGMCVIACPKKILVLSPDKINSKGYHPAELVDQSKCTGCAACAIMCPDVAIIVER
ncbi:MAG TPA: 4Fe-4S binding protein, partial [Clostridia bacterium]|nr:4Fe-4S binding protein [Clostridia bacterium]